MQGCYSKRFLGRHGISCPRARTRIAEQAPCRTGRPATDGRPSAKPRRPGLRLCGQTALCHKKEQLGKPSAALSNPSICMMRRAYARIWRPSATPCMEPGIQGVLCRKGQSQPTAYLHPTRIRVRRRPFKRYRAYNARPLGITDLTSCSSSNNTPAADFALASELGATIT